MNQVYTNVDLHYRSSELDQKQQKVGAFFQILTLLDVQSSTEASDYRLMLVNGKYFYFGLSF